MHPKVKKTKELEVANSEYLKLVDATMGYLRMTGVVPEVLVLLFGKEDGDARTPMSMVDADEIDDLSALTGIFENSLDVAEFVVGVAARPSHDALSAGLVFEAVTSEGLYIQSRIDVGEEGVEVRDEDHYHRWQLGGLPAAFEKVMKAYSVARAVRSLGI